MKKIDMYNLHKNDTLGFFESIVHNRPLFAFEYKGISEKILTSDKKLLLDTDRNTFYDYNERKKPTWTSSATLNFNAKPDHLKGKKLNLDEIHLDDFYYDYDTVKIFKVDNPKLENGFPTTEKGYLYIFNRYNKDRLTRFYIHTDNNYDTIYTPYFAGHIVRRRQEYTTAREDSYVSFNIHNGVLLSFSPNDYVALGDNRRRIDLKGEINSVGFRKFLGDTDCIVQMYVTKDRTYTRSSNGNFTKNFFETMGEVNFAYNRNQFYNNTVPEKNKLDGKSLIWGYNDNGKNNDINSVVFLDEHKKYTIKRPIFRNSDPGNTNHFDIPDYSFIPKGLIFTEAGFFRDGVTTNEELKESLLEYNNLWKVKPENNRVTRKNYSYQGQSGYIEETDKDDFVNYDIIKNPQDYLDLPTIPEYFYPKPSFIIEGDSLNDYLNHLGNLYTGENYSINLQEPWKKVYVDSIKNAFGYENNSREVKDVIEYSQPFEGMKTLNKMQDLSYIAKNTKEYELPKANVTFMEAAKQGYPFKKEETKNILKRDKNYIDWTSWTSFYYPHSDRHNAKGNEEENRRYNIKYSEVADVLKNKYNLITSYEQLMDNVKSLLPSDINLNDYTDNINEGYISGSINNVGANHFFSENIEATRFIFNTSMVYFVGSNDFLGSGPRPGFWYGDNDVEVLYASTLEQGTDLKHCVEVIGDFTNSNILESKTFPRLISTSKVRDMSDFNNIERHYNSSEEILTTSHMAFKLLIDRKDEELPRKKYGIDNALKSFQSFTIPSDDWTDVFVDTVEYVDGFIVNYPRILIPNLPDNTNIHHTVPGVEFKVTGNTIELISSRDSDNDYYFSQYKSSIMNYKTILIKKVWWR